MTIDAVKDFALDMGGVGDNTMKLEQLHAQLRGIVEAGKPLPLVEFSEGVCAFSKWPNFALPSLQMAARGECFLKHTGSGDAVVFDGDVNSSQEGKRNIRFDGFTVLPGLQSNCGLVVAACHNSYFRVNVRGAGAPKEGKLQSGIRVDYVVCTEFDNPTVSLGDKYGGFGTSLFASSDCIGMVLNHSPQHPEWQTSDARILNPILEGLTYGLWMNDAGGTMVSGGTIEGCTETGLHIELGKQNRVWATWFETNKKYDISTSSTAKNNRFDVTHPSRLKTDVKGINNTVTSTVGILGP